MSNKNSEWVWSTFVDNELVRFRNVPEVMEAVAYGWHTFDETGYLDTWDDMHRSVRRVLGVTVVDALHSPERLLREANKKSLDAAMVLLTKMEKHEFSAAVKKPPTEESMREFATAVRSAAKRLGIRIVYFPYP